MFIFVWCNTDSIKREKKGEQQWGKWELERDRAELSYLLKETKYKFWENIQRYFDWPIISLWFFCLSI